MGDKSSRQMMSPKVHVQVQLLQGFSALKKNPKQSQKRYMVSAAVPSTFIHVEFKVWSGSGPVSE